jgi:hypothetical protein
MDHPYRNETATEDPYRNETATEDPYRNETATELLLRKRKNRPLKVLVYKRRREYDGRINTMLIAAVRFNYTQLCEWNLVDSIFEHFPTSRCWNLSEVDPPTTEQVEDAIEEMTFFWTSYQTIIPTQWNVRFKGNRWTGEE